MIRLTKRKYKCLQTTTRAVLNPLVESSVLSSIIDELQNEEWQIKCIVLYYKTWVPCQHYGWDCTRVVGELEAQSAHPKQITGATGSNIKEPVLAKHATRRSFTYTYEWIGNNIGVRWSMSLTWPDFGVAQWWNISEFVLYYFWEVSVWFVRVSAARWVWLGLLNGIHERNRVCIRCTDLEIASLCT